MLFHGKIVNKIVFIFFILKSNALHITGKVLPQSFNSLFSKTVLTWIGCIADHHRVSCRHRVPYRTSHVNVLWIFPTSNNNSIIIYLLNEVCYHTHPMTFPFTQIIIAILCWKSIILECLE